MTALKRASRPKFSHKKHKRHKQWPEIAGSPIAEQGYSWMVLAKVDLASISVCISDARPKPRGIDSSYPIYYKGDEALIGIFQKNLYDAVLLEGAQ